MKKRRRTKVRRYGLGSTYYLQILPTPKKEFAKNLILSLPINTWKRVIYFQKKQRHVYLLGIQSSKLVMRLMMVPPTKLEMKIQLCGSILWTVKYPLINMIQNIFPNHLCLKIKDLWDDGKNIIVELNLLLSLESMPQ